MPNPAHQWRILLGGILGKRLRTQKGIEAEASPSRSFSQGSVTWFSLCIPLRRGQEGLLSIAFSPFPSMIISDPWLTALYLQPRLLLKRPHHLPSISQLTSCRPIRLHPSSCHLHPDPRVLSSLLPLCHPRAAGSAPESPAPCLLPSFPSTSAFLRPMSPLPSLFSLPVVPSFSSSCLSPF